MELVAGVPMLHRAVHTLAAVADDVVVISSKAHEVPQGIEVVPDVRPGLGPLGGLHTALLEAEARQLRGVLLLACDLPLVSERVIAAIGARADMSLAVAPTRPGGVEPLCAVYGCGALPLVVERLDGSDMHVRRLGSPTPEAAFGFAQMVEPFELLSGASPFGIRSSVPRSVPEDWVPPRPLHVSSA